MNIQLTKKQLEDLVKLVYLGNVMANSWREDDIIKEFDELESLVLKAAEDNGLGKFVEHVEESEEGGEEAECSCHGHGHEHENEHGHEHEHEHGHEPGRGPLVPSAELEEAAEELVDAYNDGTFWDQLIYRMADRDYARKFGEESMDSLYTAEGMDKERPLIERYEKEFFDNGLDRLEIRRDN